MERDSLKGLSNGMDSKRCMISTKPLPSLNQLMPIIGTKPASGKKDMVKMHKRGKKVYTIGYKTIKEKSQTGKRGSLQKIWTEGKDNILSVTFAVLFLKIFLDIQIELW